METQLLTKEERIRRLKQGIEETELRIDGKRRVLNWARRNHARNPDTIGVEAINADIDNLQKTHVAQTEELKELQNDEGD